MYLDDLITDTFQLDQLQGHIEWLRRKQWYAAPNDDGLNVDQHLINQARTGKRGIQAGSANQERLLLASALEQRDRLLG